ncbi:DUF3995 domain-containing protein [Arthrobacter gallicola]|uniref:DUF3995 domain-containing protein n=1 Tax=Arthrobacter gallicola TaxID=2762225 RepID=UPI001CD8699F|nr:DUF3995 domain-containing protein [Arthrobacter gallicola]
MGGDGQDKLPLGAGLLLGGIAALKAAAAVVPVAVFYGKLPWPRIWRCLSWVGGLLLVAYGGANVLISGAVLAGVLRPAGGYNVEAMIGHAFLWDPLFLVWGAALTASLWLSATRRTPRPAAGGQAEELG